MASIDPQLLPKRVTIETVFGCNAKCMMCPIDIPTSRKKGIMPFAMFTDLIDSLVPYKNNFEMMDIYGLGEPLLDPYIFERIRYVKGKGFHKVAISTNAQLLNEDKQRELLESNIDTVLFSIDGVEKKTHERIRRGTDFERVINNVLGIIEKRNVGNYRTRFVIRFIRQDANRLEWDAFKAFWPKHVSKDRGDFITTFDVHSWAGLVTSKESVLEHEGKNENLERKPCPIISDVLYVLSDGTIPLCNEDWHKAEYNFGNITKNSPIDIFNSPEFNEIREIHRKGNKRELDICQECTVLYSIENKEIA